MARPDNREQQQSSTDAPQWPQEPYNRRRTPRERASRSSLGMALVIIGLIWLAVAILPGDSENRSADGRAVVLEKTFAGSRLVLDAGAADVELNRAPGNDIHVVALRQGGSDSDYSFDISEKDGSVHVSHSARPCFIFCNRSLTYRVDMPASAGADIRTINGDIAAADLGGGLSVQTTSGDIRLSDIGGLLSVESVSGDILLDDGHVEGARVKTVSGDIDLHGVSRQLVVETTSGDMSIQGDANELTLSSASGDIAYQGSLASESNNAINTVSGDVSVQLPGDSSFMLDASTVSGDLENGFKVADATLTPKGVHGRVGAGQATLNVGTTSGDIELGAK